MGGVKKVECPECRDLFNLDPLLLEGDTTFCPSCGVELKIITIDPPTLELVSLQGTNYEDDEYEAELEEEDFYDLEDDEEEFI